VKIYMAQQTLVNTPTLNHENMFSRSQVVACTQKDGQITQYF